MLLVVAQPASELAALVRALSARYAERLTVEGASGAAEAIAVLQRQAEEGRTVALVLVAQSLPNGGAREVMTCASRLYPRARRVLLASYQARDLAVRELDTGRCNGYVLSPWEPPERGLYPQIDDALGNWRATQPPARQPLTVIGRRWSRRAFDLREFLGRNEVPYRWIEAESEEGQNALRRLCHDEVRLPLLVFPNGETMAHPDRARLAERLGLHLHPEQPFYDLVVIGAGPAGLAAAVYGASEGLHTVLVEREAPGGQAGTSSHIDNYLGFPAGLTGHDLARRAVAQAVRFGVELVTPQTAVALRIQDPYRYVRLADGREIGGYAILIATGVDYRRLEVPGDDRLIGRGVYYGSSLAEALRCRGLDVLVVGGANSAGQAALHLAEYARAVTMVVLEDDLAVNMSQYLVDEIRQTPNIAVRPHSSVIAMEGEGHLEGVIVRDNCDGTEERIVCPAVFIFIGALPQTDWVAGVLERDESGFILSGSDLTSEGRPQGWIIDRDPYLMETNVPGIFVAGDVRANSVRRVAAAIGQGATAVASIHRYMGELGHGPPAATPTDRSRAVSFDEARS